MVAGTTTTPLTSGTSVTGSRNLTRIFVEATLAATATKQVHFLVIKKEEPFQLCPRERTRELAVHRYRVFTEKYNWHDTNLG